MYVMSFNYLIFCILIIHVWFQVFVPGMEAKKVDFPVILFTDNHSSHISQEIVDQCLELKVILVGLHKNATFLHQPCDALFGVLKENFVNILFAKRRQLFQIGKDFQLTHLNFSKILKETIQLTISPELVKWSFEKTGIYPFNADGIDYTQLKTKITERKDYIQKSLEILNSINSKIHIDTLDMSLSDEMRDDIFNDEEEINEVFNDENFDDDIDSNDSFFELQVLTPEELLNENSMQQMDSESNDSEVVSRRRMYSRYVRLNIF